MAQQPKPRATIVAMLVMLAWGAVLAPARAAIVTLGDVSPNPVTAVVTGTLGIAPSPGGVGQVQVSSGSSLTVDRLFIGAGGNTSSNGTLILGDAGTRVRVTRNEVGSVDVGSTGTGRLTVLDGAVFRYDGDPGNCATGGCSVFVSNGAGSTGHLLVSGPGALFDSQTTVVVGHKSVFTQATDGFNYGQVGGTSNATLLVDRGATGRSATLVVGSAGGGNGRTEAEQANGAVQIDGNGSAWLLTRSAATIGSAAGLSVGSARHTGGRVDITGGGRMLLDGGVAPNEFYGVSMGNGGSTAQARLHVTGAGSSLSIQGGMGFINVGSGGVGSNANMEISGGARVDGNGDSGLPFVNVGRGGAIGTLTVQGADVANNASTLQLNGHNPGTDAGAFLAIGVRQNNLAGTGTVNVLDGASLIIDTRSLVLTNGNGQSGMHLGSGVGTSGSLLLSGVNAANGAPSRLEILGSSGVTPYVAIGREGGTGDLRIAAGARLTMDSTHVSTTTPTYAPGDAMWFEIGRRNSPGEEVSTGTVTVQGAGSRLELLGSVDRYIQVGLGTNGRGTLNVEQGGMVQTLSMLVANGPTASGTLNLQGGTLLLGGHVNGGGAPGTGGSLSIGRDGGTGAATIDGGSQVLLTSATAPASINLGGTSVAPGGTGTMMVSGGSTVVVTSPQARLNVGARASAERAGVGLLTIAGGSTVAALGDDARVVIATGANTQGAVIVGAGSTLAASGFLGVAHNRSASTGGSGTLVVNGHASAPEIYVGTTGLIVGSGTLSGHVTNLGVINVGNSPGRMFFDGTLDTRDGKLVLEVQRNAAGGWDVDELVFDDVASFNIGQAAIEFVFLGDTDPNAFNASGLFTLASFFKMNDGQGGVTDLPADFVDEFGAAAFGATADHFKITNFSFTPRGGASFDATAIPVPSTLALALMAVGLLGLRRARVAFALGVRH